MVNVTAVVLYAQLLTGRKYVPGQSGQVHLEKQWSKQIMPFAYQTIVKVDTRTETRTDTGMHIGRHTCIYTFLSLSPSFFVRSPLLLVLFSPALALLSPPALSPPLRSLSLRISRPLTRRRLASRPWKSCFPRRPQCSWWGTPTTEPWERSVPLYFLSEPFTLPY